MKKIIDCCSECDSPEPIDVVEFESSEDWMEPVTLCKKCLVDALFLLMESEQKILLNKN